MGLDSGADLNSGNRFRRTSLTEPEKRYFCSILGRVDALSLEDTLLSWNEVRLWPSLQPSMTDRSWKICAVTTLFRSLTSLVASNNVLKTISHGSLPSSLTSLDLEGNDFEDLSALAPLTSLPKLQRLSLKSNAISRIFPNPSHSSAEDVSSTSFAQSLQILDLSYNEISEWSLIDSLLDIFPGLTALRVAHNPLFHGLQTPDGKPLSADDGYMLTIARLGSQLKTLNFSTITAKERLNAETYYLSLIATELSLHPESAKDAILARNRRYAELCKEYGDPAVSRAETIATVDPNTLAARLIKFTFKISDSTLAREPSAPRPPRRRHH